VLIVYSGTVSVIHDGLVLEKLKRGSFLSQTQVNDLKSAGEGSSQISYLCHSAEVVIFKIKIKNLIDHFENTKSNV
jgi:hypothetical protein